MGRAERFGVQKPADIIAVATAGRIVLMAGNPGRKKEPPYLFRRPSFALSSSSHSLSLSLPLSPPPPLLSLPVFVCRLVTLSSGKGKTFGNPPRPFRIIVVHDRLKPQIDPKRQIVPKHTTITRLCARRISDMNVYTYGFVTTLRSRPYDSAGRVRSLGRSVLDGSRIASNYEPPHGPESAWPP